MATNIITTGFIVDAPSALIRTSSGAKSIINAQSGEVTFSGDAIAIEGGWGFFPLADIDSKKGIEVKLVDAEWSLDSEQLTSGGTVSTGSTVWDFYGKKYTIDVAGKVTIAKAIIAGSVFVPGYTETTVATPAANQFKVTISGSSTDILFPVSDAGKVVEISYKATITDGITLSVRKTDKPKTGEIILTFPIYDGEDGDGDGDSNEVESYLQIIIYKGKISPSSKTGGSRKSASTKEFTIKGLDPKRPDEKIFDYRLISKDDYLG